MRPRRRGPGRPVPWRRRHGWRFAAGLAAALLLGGLWGSCGPPPEPSPGPAPGVPEPGEPEPGEPARAEEAREEAEEGALPPIPPVTGPLSLHVQYPPRNHRIAVRDSNFLFGTVGTGDAALAIDGRPVPVEPNGAFLAFLPVPPPRGDTAVYRLVARRGEEVATLLHPVRVPPVPHAGPTGTAWLDTTELRPLAERWALPEEGIELSVRGAAGLGVWAAVGGERFVLKEGPDPAAVVPRETAGAAAVSRRYGARIPAGRLASAAGLGRERRRAGERAAPVRVAETGQPLDSLLLATPDTVEITLVGAVAGDTARFERRLPLRLLDPEALPVVGLWEAPDTVNGQSGVVVGRPGPYGPYRWRFPPGALGLVDGRLADRLRLRLAPHESAWVLVEDVEPLPPGTPAPSSRVGDVRVEPLHDRLVVRVGLETPLPIQVEEPDERTIVLTLYGGRGETDRIAYGERDPLLESVGWEQATEATYRVLLRLREPVWGYRAGYERADASAYEGPRGAEGADDGPVLRFEVRRPPPIDPDRPLRGRRVAVDPGHPGGGATGPTGFYEGDANLAVARRLVEMLREEGADPVLIRRDTLPMGLYERTGRALDAGAELFVSIHNNALPDGVRPFDRTGTSTYHYHAHSRELAETVQAGMLAEMGLRDLGILWGDLAVTRMSWMPSVLAEGAFLMIPREEAALRHPDFQARYARGVLRGIRDFLARRAAARRP